MALHGEMLGAAAGRAAVPIIGLLVALTGCSGDPPAQMPNVVGKKLDVAKSDVKRAGIDGEVEVVGGGMLGIVVESNWTVCSQDPSGGAPVKDQPRLVVDRSCESSTPQPSASSESGSTGSGSAAPPYSGPRYEVVITDEDQGPARLTQYWVVTAKLDYSTPAYKDQVKAVLSDLARKAGGADFIAEIVTDREIAEAESPSTYEDFIAEHGEEYAIKEIPKREKTTYVATYTGGFDYGEGEASESEAAYAIDWWPAADTEHELWKPSATE